MKLDTANSCSFEADDYIVTITALPEIGEIVLSGALGLPPPEQLEQLYKFMLEANHNYNSTFGASLGLDSDTGHFSLSKVLSCQTLGDDGLYNEMESFLSICDNWRKVISNYRYKVETNPAEKAEINYDLMNGLSV